MIPSAIEWVVREDVKMFSYHTLIAIRLFQHSIRSIVCTARTWSSADWLVFNQRILLALDCRLLEDELLGPNDLDRATKMISRSIQQVIVGVVSSKQIVSSLGRGGLPSYFH